MDCSETGKRISLSIDDRLSPDERKAFSAHLRTCPGCQEALKESQAVYRLLASTERFSAPTGFTTRVMTNLETKKPSRLVAFFTVRPLVLRTMEVAFAVIVAMIGLHSGRLLIADRVSPQRPVTFQESFSLDLFQATPPDSIGGAYIALAEAAHEK